MARSRYRRSPCSPSPFAPRFCQAETNLLGMYTSPPQALTNPTTPLKSGNALCQIVSAVTHPSTNASSTASEILAKLAFPDFVTGSEVLSFGHMRQVHVLAVILGWISMAFAMAMMYITPALGNTKLWSEKLGVWNCFLWNVGLSLGLFLSCGWV